MIAIILAAGQGIRLGYDIPKTMVEVEGVPLIRRQINILKRLNINKIFIVIGQGKVWKEENQGKLLDMVKPDEVEVIINQDSLTTQSPASLRLALRNIDEDCVIIDGDLAFGPGIIETISDSEQNTILISENIDKKGSKVIVRSEPREGYLLHSIGETLESDYVYSGIMRIQKNDLSTFRDSLNTKKYDEEILAIFLGDICKKVSIYCVKLLKERYGHRFLELAQMAGGSFAKTSRIIK